MAREDYMVRTKAIEYIQKNTEYGLRVIERKVNEMAEQGLIILKPDPGRRSATLISKEDTNKVIAALTL